ncbi:MAG: FAD-dependent oxidoreductase [Halioglobus sp.]
MTTTAAGSLIAKDGSFCIHCAFEPGESDYDFRLKDWIFDQRDEESYEIPFRCLYSKNINNLMMAGKHISVTHVAASATKLMGNGAQHGVAVGAAAYLCLKYETSPRGLYNNYLIQLKEQVGELTSCDHDITSSPPKRKFKAVPG